MDVYRLRGLGRPHFWVRLSGPELQTLVDLVRVARLPDVVFDDSFYETVQEFQSSALRELVR